MMQSDATTDTATAKSRQPPSPKASNQAELSSAELAKRRAELEEQRTHPPVSPEDDALVRELRERAARKRQEADAVDAQIAEIDATLGVQERMRRQDAERTRQAGLSAAKKNIADKFAERQQVMAEFESGTRQAAASLVRLTVLDRELRQAGAVLGDGLAALSDVEGPRRYSGRFIAVMSAAVFAYRNRFGFLPWPNASLYSATKPWAEDEARLLQPVLNRLMEKD